MAGDTMAPHEILERLHAVLQARRDADPASSYVASLYHRGLDVILKKLGEEATETIVAAKNEDPQALIGELADLWFHSLVLMVHRDVAPDEVLGELARRFGVSGHDEKAARAAPRGE